MDKKKFVVPVIVFLTACGGDASNASSDSSSLGEASSVSTVAPTVLALREGRAYGIVYSDFVGAATVTVMGNTPQDMRLDEAYLPHMWARIEEAGALDEALVYIAPGDASMQYARYISVSGILFECADYPASDAQADGTTKQKVLFRSEEISNLYTYLKEPEHARWYFESVVAGTAFPCDDRGAPLQEAVFANDTMLKSQGGYWEMSNGLGWSGNLRELIVGAQQGGFAEAPHKNDDGYVQFGNILTGATCTAYLEYYELLKKAYEDALEKPVISSGDYTVEKI